jgi:PAS domain-containing protein
MDQFALNIISEGVLFVNNGRVSFINRRLEDFVQYSAKELINSDHVPFFTPECEFKFFNLVRETQSLSVPMDDIFDLMNNSNEVVSVSIHVSPYDAASVCCIFQLPSQDFTKVQVYI